VCLSRSRPFRSVSPSIIVRGEEKLTYVVVSVDNTDGTEPANMYSLVFVTQDGEHFAFGTAV
jgi:hypothetical protein